MALPENEIVTALSRYVTQPDSYSFGKDSPLQAAVRNQMRSMVADMASEIIRNTPEVREVMDRLIRKSVEDALRDDAFLNNIVSNAVAKALVTRDSDA